MMSSDADVFESDASFATVTAEKDVLERLVQIDDKRFLKGVAISMWQNSGDADSNWTRFVNQRRYCGLKSTVEDGTISVFPDTWNRYEEDIALLKELNCNAFRFSMEWARIEPERGRYDAEAIARYDAIFDCLEKNGMTASVTMHHFVHPGWFQDLGGFEKEENIGMFIDFCVHVFSHFHHRTIYWATFNEPTVYTFCSYLAGLHAPGTAYWFRQAGVVLLNILKAHCQVYEALRDLSCGKECSIGMVHHNIWFAPMGESILEIASRWASKWMTFWWGRDVVLKFFKTGYYKWQVPFIGGGVEYTFPEGRPPCDWWGINYYSRVKLNWMLQSKPGNEIMTDMAYPIHPKGLYRAIKASSALGLPIFITETGVADNRDDRRHIMIKGYTNELIRSLKHGYDVRGVFYWTLVDNFEWNLGYKPRFGLYEFDPSKGVDRRLRQNAKVLQGIYNEWPDKLEDMYRHARGRIIPSFKTIATEYKEGQMSRTPASIG